VSRTTPPPARDVTALFPGIGPYARTATRLHPRPGTPDPRGSHVGGPLRWPAGEPWPTCAAAHLVTTETPIPEPILARLKGADPRRGWPGYTAAIAELASLVPGFGGVNRGNGSAVGTAVLAQPEPGALVPVAQLRAADVPDLCPPDGADLLQVLWCPNDHEHDGDGATWAPAVTLRWRRERDVPDVLERPPAPAMVSQPRYLPRPCVLRPERVVEYPWWQELPTALGRPVGVWDAAHDGLYHRRFATAPGWKVGGWASWPTTDPVPRYCPRCGAPMRLLFQIDSGEWGDPERWRPAEESGLRPGTPGYGSATEPTGVVAGRSGLYRVFHCPSCPDAPVRVDLQ
jgi:hypothetical protein